MQGLQHVEYRDHVIGRRSLYLNGPREQVREEDDGAHVRVRHRLTKERGIEGDWRSLASRQRRLSRRRTGTLGEPPSLARFPGNGLHQLGRGYGDVEVQRRDPAAVRYSRMNALSHTVGCNMWQRDVMGEKRAGGGQLRGWERRDREGGRRGLG